MTAPRAILVFIYGLRWQRGGTSLAERRVQAAGGDYRANVTTGQTTTGPGSQQEMLF